jgi:prespore-specific regulator
MVIHHGRKNRMINKIIKHCLNSLSFGHTSIVDKDSMNSINSIDLNKELLEGCNMVATRQDAWSEDDDLLLAEVTLRHIREGGTQLSAFEEVGYRLGRTAAACGFRWNSLVRKKYESAIQIAKAQRQQRKSRGRSRYVPENEPALSPTPNRVQEYVPKAAVNQYNNKEYAEFSQELNGAIMQSAKYQLEENLDFDDVIRFLRLQKDSYKKFRQVDKELKEKDREIGRLREENEKMKKDLGSVQTDYQSMNEDYKALIKIMDRARKLAFLAEEEQEDKVSFKMDRNGNLERVEKS